MPGNPGPRIKHGLDALNLKKIIETKDSEGFVRFYKEIYKALSKDKDLEMAYRRMYRALKAI
ncbi:MAG: hypothetical protein QXP78_04445 [Candidatus Bathyarchaeia archaeon]